MFGVECDTKQNTTPLPTHAPWGISGVSAATNKRLHTQGPPRLHTPQGRLFCPVRAQQSVSIASATGAASQPATALAEFPRRENN